MCGLQVYSPLQCSCLENSMDRGAWQATVQVVKSQTRLKIRTWLKNLMRLKSLTQGSDQADAPLRERLIAGQGGTIRKRRGFTGRIHFSEGGWMVFRLNKSLSPQQAHRNSWPLALGSQSPSPHLPLLWTVGFYSRTVGPSKRCRTSTAVEVTETTGVAWPMSLAAGLDSLSLAWSSLIFGPPALLGGFSVFLRFREDLLSISLESLLKPS